jgi:hypothetical protein
MPEHDYGAVLFVVVLIVVVVDAFLKLWLADYD